MEFNADSIEILRVFRSCSEDENIVWIQFSDYFAHFHKMNIVIFFDQSG